MRYLSMCLPLVLVAGADGSMIELSDFSSDETPASVLSATFDFDVLGSSLTLTVTNSSDYNINEVYFNAPDSVTGLSLTPVPGWTLSSGVAAAGFGVFDWAIIDGVGESNENTIMPGESLSFSMTLSGFASMSDFVSEFSTIPPGDMPSIVAAKFVSGPGDDSAWGAAVPAPGALALLGLGGLSSSRRRRR